MPFVKNDEPRSGMHPLAISETAEQRSSLFAALHAFALGVRSQTGVVPCALGKSNARLHSTRNNARHPENSVVEWARLPVRLPRG